MELQLGNTTKEPTTSTRFLAVVWLDRKLTWKAHLKEVQRLALTRLAAATWGFSLPREGDIQMGLSILVHIKRYLGPYQHPGEKKHGPSRR